MTIPAGSNSDNHSTPSHSSWWTFSPSTRPARNDGAHQILVVESYGAGSHLRVAHLLQKHSQHRIDILQLARDHWRSLAFTGHRAIARALRSLDLSRYQLIVFSGPADIRLSVLALAGRAVTPRIVAYLHESQWTYPAGSLDRIPHLVNHLETVELCDAVWFNSRFHRSTFHDSALEHPSRTVRALANEIIPAHWHKTQVVYPPVEVTPRPRRRSTQPTISWSARWEQEKRPDQLLATIHACLDAGLEPRLHILGSERDQWLQDPAMDDRVRATIQPESGYLTRDEYEAVLAGSDIWLSTAEHEYFGISAIEAAMLGATPVVPAGLAYPETLPSALTYPPGSAEAAARRILAIAAADRPLAGAWQLDARRYRLTASIDRFDTAVSDQVSRAAPG